MKSTYSSIMMVFWLILNTGITKRENVLWLTLDLPWIKINTSAT